MTRQGFSRTRAPLSLHMMRDQEVHSTSTYELPLQPLHRSQPTLQCLPCRSLGVSLSDPRTAELDHAHPVGHARTPRARRAANNVRAEVVKGRAHPQSKMQLHPVLHTRLLQDAVFVHRGEFRSRACVWKPRLRPSGLPASHDLGGSTTRHAHAAFAAARPTWRRMDGAVRVVVVVIV